MFLKCVCLNVKLTSQIITFEHEGNWNKALEYYDLQVRFHTSGLNNSSIMLQEPIQQRPGVPMSITDDEISQRKAYKGLVRSLQQIGCTHVLDLYCQGLTSRNSQFHQDREFTELQVCYLLPCTGKALEAEWYCDSQI